MDDTEKLKQRFELFVADVPTVEELGVLMRCLGHNPSDAVLSDLVVNAKSVDAFISMMGTRKAPADDEIPQLIDRLHQDISKLQTKAPADNYKHQMQKMALEFQVTAVTLRKEGIERQKAEALANVERIERQKAEAVAIVERIERQKAEAERQKAEAVANVERIERQKAEAVANVERIERQKAEAKLEAGTSEKNDGDDGPAPMPPGVEDTLSSAWDKTYEGSLVLDYVMKTLDEYAGLWTTPAYASPWTCMVQSSGWGKSRTVCQLSSHGVFVIYISFKDSALPRGTPGAKDYFVRVKEDVRKTAAAFVGCMSRLLEELEKKGNNTRGFPEEWVSMQTSPNKTNVWQEHRWGMLEGELSNLSKSTHSDVTLDEWEDNALTKWVDSHMKAFKEKTAGKVRQQGLKLLFCLDEAGSLFEENEKLFMTMRRAFSCFPRWEFTLAIVMDTSARLQLLAPSRLANRSQKGRLSETKVFPPLCLAGESWFSCKALMSARCGIDIGDKATRMLFTVGRPLWRACLHGQPDSKALPTQTIVSYAVQKLLGGRSLTDVTEQKSFNEEMAIGIIGSSVGVEVVAWSSLAEKLVASHMKTAVAVSDERDRLFNADTAEPILGEAAAQVLQSKDMLLKVLVELEAVCKQAYVLEGPREELIGRLILLLTMHACLKEGGTFSWPVPLQKFLSKLCGKEVKCSEALVFFNRCCVVSGDLTQKVLLHCYLGCFAVIPRRNQAGYDFVIPVLHASEDGNYVLDEKHMGAIPCQFKDRNLYGIQAGPVILWAKHFEFLKKPKSESDNEIVDIRAHYLQYEKACIGRTDDDDDDDEVLPDAAAAADDDDEDPFMPYSAYKSFIEDDQEKRKVAQQTRSEITKKRREDHTKANKEEITNIFNEIKRLKRNADEGINVGKAVGLYFHLNSPRKSKKNWVIQIGETIVLHGISSFSFLDEDVIKRLEVLRYAYHSLENLTEKKSDQRKCLEHVVWPYFRLFRD